MNKDKPMPILLIEDDVEECRKFKDFVANRTDVNFVGITASSNEAVKLVKSHLPEGIILDLELSKGEGTGLQFLATLNSISLGLRPIVVVTTNIQSNVMYAHIHNMGIAFIFYKKQAGYSTELVINTLLELRNSLFIAQTALHRDLQTIESPEELRMRIIERIDAELNQIGISIKLKGRAYLQEAIYLLVNKERNESTAVLYQVAENNRINYNSIIRAIQTAIQKIWDSSDIETLKEKYPVHINIHTGVPAPTEFIHYYAEKIRKTI